MLDLVRADPTLGEPLVPGLPYLKAEARFAVRHEMARTLSDVLDRRTRARLLDRDATAAAARRRGRAASRPISGGRTSTSRGGSRGVPRVDRRRARAVGMMRRAIALSVLLAIVLVGHARDSLAQAKKRATPTTTTTTTWPPLPATQHHGDVGRLRIGLRVRHPLGAGRLALAPTASSSRSRWCAIAPRGPTRASAALVVNYGGPGQGGVDYLPRVWSRIPAPMRARFDIVSWDPRGTGASRPVDCVDDASLDDVDEPPRGPRHRGVAGRRCAAYNDMFAKGCTARSGAYAGQVGTRNTARDLEAIRRALGEPKLTYLGYSYGTVVGATYAQMFPSTVRAMVLDGPADWWAPRLDYVYAQAQGFKQALDAFLASCGPTCPADARRAHRTRRVRSVARVVRPQRRDACRRAHRQRARDRRRVRAVRPARVAHADERAAVGRGRRLGRPAALAVGPVLPARRPTGRTRRSSSPTRSSTASTIPSRWRRHPRRSSPT